MERVRDDADLREVAARLLRTDRAAPLGERKFALFGLGKIFEAFEARALPLASSVARFAVARLGDAETLSDSTYCQALCRCCEEVADACAAAGEGKYDESGTDSGRTFAFSGGSDLAQPEISKFSSFMSASTLLDRSWAPGDREAWFQPTTALALSAGPGLRSSRTGQRVQKTTYSRIPALDVLVGVIARAALHSDCVTQQNAAEALAVVLHTVPPDVLTESGLQKLYAGVFAECAKKHDGIGRKYS